MQLPAVSRPVFGLSFSLCVCVCAIEREPEHTFYWESEDICGLIQTLKMADLCFWLGFTDGLGWGQWGHECVMVGARPHKHTPTNVSWFFPRDMRRSLCQLGQNQQSWIDRTHSDFCPLKFDVSCLELQQKSQLHVFLPAHTQGLH